MTNRTQKETALDGFLVASARLGDRQALGRLVERWDPKLKAHAWRLLGDHELARDAVQDSWYEIVRGLRRLRHDAAFASWAYRIVSRRCARAIGRAQRQRQLGRDVASAPPVAVVETDATATDRLRAAVRALPPEQRAAVALYYFDELSVTETAVALDVPAGTVKSRLALARRRLRVVLEGEA
jgi:RNA polymerase sigma-70 factor (ECF subfamily)